MSLFASRRPGRAIALAVACALASVIALSAASAQRSTPSNVAPPYGDSTVALGLAAWKAGDCESCHGHFATGEEVNSISGANLRETSLTRPEIFETIRCGRPGTGMPAHDRLAWTERSCFGQQGDAPPSGHFLGVTLSDLQIVRLIDYLYARVIRRGPVKYEACMEYFGVDTEPQRAFCYQYPPDTSIIPL